MLKLRYQENDLNTANLYLNESRVSKISRLTPSVVSITGLFESDRTRVEDFIKNIYSNSYGADINIEYPVLMSVRNEEDKILAALGFRYAKDETLFLEQYTGKPIEKIIHCERKQIVEIGNLASAGQGASIFLFAALASYLNNKNISYATVTGTDFLHHYLKKIGLNPRKICDAKIASLEHGGQKWGTYYNSHPRVLMGSVEAGIERLKKTLGAEFENCRPRLYPRLHYGDKS